MAQEQTLRRVALGQGLLLVESGRVRGLYGVVEKETGGLMCAGYSLTLDAVERLLNLNVEFDTIDEIESLKCEACAPLIG